MIFAEFVREPSFEQHAHPTHREFSHLHGMYVPAGDIDANAVLSGLPRYLEAEAQIGAHSELHTGIEVRFRARIADMVYLGENAVVGADVYVGEGAFIAEEARLDPRFVSTLPNAKGIDEQYTGIESGAIIGEGVAIAGGVSIPEELVIPHPDAIMSFSHHGNSNGVVSVYGTDEGPRYTVRCQRAIDINTFRTRVMTGTETDTASANRYKPYVKKGGVFEMAGLAVQQVYEREANHVDELRERQIEAHKAMDDFHENRYHELLFSAD